jgi:hypothetical protein
LVDTVELGFFVVVVVLSDWAAGRTVVRLILSVVPLAGLGLGVMVEPLAGIATNAFLGAPLLMAMV